MLKADWASTPQWAKQRVLAVSPFEMPDFRLVSDFLRAGACAFLDVGRDWALAKTAITKIRSASGETFGLRIPEGMQLPPDALPDLQPQVAVLLHASPECFVPLPGFRHLVEVVSLDEALEAQRRGADGLVLKGAESGGRIGKLNSFILLQQVHGRLTVPFWVQGGMGPHGAAAAVFAGAQGVVYDAQLALLPSSRLPAERRNLLRGLNGSETAVAAGYRFLRHKLLPDVADEASRAELLAQLSGPDRPLLAGEDIALAELFQTHYKDAATLVQATEEAIAGHLRQARQLDVFGRGSDFAREYRLAVPVLQGPMTRVSDTPGFAAAVADGGGLPAFAMAVLAPEQARPLLTETRERLHGRSWAVGLLGFLPPELYQQQVALVQEIAPPYVIIAGGRPDQGKAFEAKGIGTFLHCPTPRLFDHFVENGARRFIFEGRECGGHVGPLSSLTLWESQITRALESDHAGELTLVFAGGLHDARSVALLSAMCAPLAALGAKLGLLMGTAYLFTEEAVREGAILPAYQALAVSSAESALIQTGPGHVTRCLHTPYVDFIEAERARLKQEGKSRDEIFLALEQLNVGHLRIASKGKKRVDGVLVDVDAATQQAEGMYMIGDVVGLRHEVTTIARLHDEVSSAAALLRARPLPALHLSRTEPACDIAIVGMAGIFPGAATVQEFWANVIEGKDCVTEVPDSRWDKARYYDAQSTGARGEKTNSKWGGFIPDFHFDPALFGIPPQSLGSIDPAQLAALLVAHQALQDAGYLERSFNRERTSVVFGVEPGGDISGAYGLRIMLPQLLSDAALAEARAALPGLTEDSFPGVLGNVVSGRISNRLDLGGQNFTIDAACASSLAAIDAAIKELRYGESDLAIAGGVDFHNGIHDYLMFCSTHALSPRGKCFTFSETADGITLGEGAGAVVLKRYEDAVADEDHIYAVIRGIGGASDGKSLGLTAPRKQGQLRALQRAYRRAGISPAEVGLLEAHGTGTVVGDRTELASMETVYAGAGSAPGSCALGSVKTQIGHTKCAAGVASLIKCAYAVEQGLLPPTLNIEQPNASYRGERSPFYFLSRTAPWLAADRKAGVSSFGFGGTNYHLVLDRGRLEDQPAAPAVWPFELFLFRGDTLAAARARVEQLQAFAATGRRYRLADLAVSHHQSNEGEGPVQLAVVAATLDELIRRLDAAAQGQADPRGVFVSDPRLESGAVAFLFPGQGSQYLGMGAELFTYFPDTRGHLAAEPALQQVMWPPMAFSDTQRAAQEAALTDTRNAQPALGACSLAAMQILAKFGIHAGHAAGHSYGELAALCHAGSLRAADLLMVSRLRAESILGSLNGGDRGGMLAVEADEARVRDVLGDLAELDLANLNSPKQTVLAGPSALIEKAQAAFGRHHVRARILPVACAFHSRKLAGAATRFTLALQDVVLAPPGCTVWANTTAAPYPAELSPDALAEQLGRQIAAPVRFVELVRGMYDAGVRTFIEVGAGNTLSGLVNHILTGEPVQTVPLLLREAPPLKALLTGLARLAVSGIPLNTDALYAQRRLQTLDLARPQPLAKTTWVVNGQYARPLHGALPPQAYHPAAAHQLRLAAPDTATPAVDGGSRDVVLQRYFESLNRFVEHQRDIMLGYLGTAPAPAAASTYAPPAATIAAQSVAQASAAPAEAPARPLPADRVSIEIRLKALICARTGYPEDMLEPTLDLEADLGIDSIKRVELLSEIAQQLGITHAGSRQALGEETANFLEEVSKIKTLAGISEWLANHLQRTAAPAATAAIPAAGPRMAFDRGAIEARLKALICERTGYPEEMLDAHLDLEADLGIDSIKRVELLSEIGKELGIAAGNSPGELGEGAAQFLEEVSKIKTLAGISDWLANYGRPPAPTAATASEPEPEPVVAGTTAGGVPLRALNVLYDEKPLTACPTGAVAGKVFHVVGATPAQLAALQRQLQACGASLYPLEREHLKTGLQLAGNGILYFNRPDDPYQDVLGLFHALRACDPQQLDTVLAIQHDPRPLRNAGGGYRGPSQGSGTNGFLVSLRWEWPKIRVIRQLVLHDEADLEPEALAGRVAAEVLSEPEVLAQPVAYCQGRRYVRKALLREPLAASCDRFQLSRDDVVVIVGGAKGITSWFAAAFAKRYQCRLVLLGRSPLPPETDPFPGLDTAVELRRALLAQSRLKPREIEPRIRQLLADKQMRTTLQELRDHGSEFSYFQTDVTEAAQVDAALGEVMRRYGRIDGVLFGAGILDDRFLKDKEETSVARIYHTKVTGAENVLNSLDRFAQPKFVVFFSSLSATLGNRGQTDYSAANAYLDERALALNASREGHYLSVNWGPWEGLGMIDETLQKHLEGMGVHAIKRHEGVDFLFNELAAGKGSGLVIAMCAKDEALYWTE